jgi:hypothetical protein
MIVAELNLTNLSTCGANNMMVMVLFPERSAAESIAPLSTKTDDPEQYPAISKGFKVAIHSRQSTPAEETLQLILNLLGRKRSRRVQKQGDHLPTTRGHLQTCLFDQSISFIHDLNRNNFYL